MERACSALLLTATAAIRGHSSASSSRAALARSVVSITSELSAESLASLEGAGERVVRLRTALCVDDTGAIVGDDVAAMSLRGTVGWVHVASDFEELVAARRAGATTIWLNDAAAATAGDLETQGYLATAIIDDFADAICADPAELVEAAVAARRARGKDSPANDGFAREQELASAAKADPGEGVTTSAIAEQLGVEVQTSMKFCIECGAQLPVRANFCSACGQKQDTEENSEAFSRKPS